MIIKVALLTIVLLFLSFLPYFNTIYLCYFSKDFTCNKCIKDKICSVFLGTIIIDILIIIIVCVSVVSNLVRS